MKNLLLMLFPLFLLACNDGSAERAKQEAARIDSIARVWLHVWIRYRKWATGKE